MIAKTSHRQVIISKKGIIKKDSDADLVILDLQKNWIVKAEKLVSKGKRCADLYYGDKIKGTITTTIVNGNIVYEKNKFIKPKNQELFVFPENEVK